MRAACGRMRTGAREGERRDPPGSWLVRGAEGVLEEGIIKTAPPLDRASPGPAGVRTCRLDRIQPGYTLFSPGMGNLVCLIDAAGVLVHFWPVQRTHLCALLPNGNLLVDRHGDEGGVEELDPEARCVWAWRGPVHHDFQPLPDGGMVMLTHRQEPAMDGFFDPGETPQTIRNDVVVEIDRDGAVRWEFSFREHADALARLSGLPRPVRYGMRRHDGSIAMLTQADWTHSNTLEVLPDTPLGRRDPRFRAGNLLFSCRSLDVIGVIDRERSAFVWAWGPGVLDGQHQPTMLADGHILIFDNGTYRGYSVAREIDPSTGRTVWEYRDPEGFFSPYRSGVQRLADGNTLICSSDEGRIFEVTPQGEVVWDYHSPFWGTNRGNEGRHVYRATRYSEAEVAGLFDRKGDCAGAVGLGEDWRRRPHGFRDVLGHYQKTMLSRSW